MMDTIPNDAVILRSHHWKANCKNQLSLECLDKQCKYFPTFFRIRYVATPSVTRETLSISCSRTKAVANRPGLNIWISIAMQVLFKLNFHFTRRLVTSPDAISYRAYSALKEFTLRHLRLETFSVEAMISALLHQNDLVNDFLTR
jgi:hypothetical protein